MARLLMFLRGGLRMGCKCKDCGGDIPEWAAENKYIDGWCLECLEPCEQCQKLFAREHDLLGTEERYPGWCRDCIWEYEMKIGP